jgi:subtilisin family serine protease
MTLAPLQRVVRRVSARRASHGRRNAGRLWAALVVLAVGVAAGAGAVLADPSVRLGAASLANEWRACLLEGAPPQPQPVIADRHASHVLESRRRSGIPGESVALPVVEPRDHIPLALMPHPDRPDSLPRRVVVAVIDSGVTSTHPDVAGARILPGVDLVNPCGDGRQDVTGHGTAVAGVLVSSTHGAAPGVDILPIRISLATGRHQNWVSAAAIVAATNRGADVINMSYTNQQAGPSLLEWVAVRYASARGVALVAAAGNNPHKPAGYPAAYPAVLSVTAVNAHGELSSYSARNGKVDVAAPGSRVLTLSPEGGMRTASGTSLAAPIVTASLTHLLQTDPSLRGAEAVAAVQESSTPAPPAVVAQPFGAFNLSSALAGVCRLASVCQFTGTIHRSYVPTPLPIGDPRRPPTPGEPR